MGGRGKLGNTDFYHRIDLHVDYPFRLSEGVRLSVSANFFNITNNRDVRLPDQFKELDFGAINSDFLKPVNFRPPFNMYMGVKLSF